MLTRPQYLAVKYRVLTVNLYMRKTPRIPTASVRNRNTGATVSRWPHQLSAEQYGNKGLLMKSWAILKISSGLGGQSSKAIE